VSEKTEQIDYDALQKQAEEVKPAMITAGASAIRASSIFRV
jgi:glycine/serine hydroxymethyltransferase